MSDFRRMLVTLLRQIAVIAALVVPLLACVRPDGVELRSVGYNERLRPDREPLSPEQTFSDPQDLRYGYYSSGSGELVRALTPALNGPVHHLPQADCHWLAQSAHGGGDAMRAHWEAVVELAAGSDYEDPGDSRLELGLCRVNDPETRRPLLARDRSDDTFRELYVDDNTDPEHVFRATLRPGENLPRLLNDQFVLSESLTALRSTVTDLLNSCTNRLGSYADPRASIERGVDFFDGPTGEGKVSSCIPAGGATLIAPEHTQYLLQSTNGGPAKPLEPVVMIARRNDTTARPLEPDTNAVRWLTPVQTRGSGRRWTETFSPNIAVRSVRLLRLVADRIEYLGEAPQLCIVDQDSVPGCRWTCADSDPAPTVTRYDLGAGTSCRDRLGVPATPGVNPTFAIDTWRQAPLIRPLEWRFAFAPTGLVFVEFTLTHTLDGMALTAEPAGLDLGRVPPGERRPGHFSVTNFGAEPVRVTRAQIDPAWRQAPSYSLRLPHAPEPLPIGIEAYEVKPGVVDFSLPPSFEQYGLVAQFRGPAHWHLRPTVRPNTPILYDGMAIGARDGTLWRDRAEQRIVYRAPGKGVSAPVRATVWAERTLPFVVMPGERFELMIVAAPSTPGTHEARVEIAAESVLDPSQRQAIAVGATAYGSTGPLPWLGPAQRYWDARRAAAMPQNFLVVNNGDSRLNVSSVGFTAENGGPLAAANNRFRVVAGLAAPFSINAGASEVLGIEYVPSCGASGEVEHRAALRVASAAGSLSSLLVGRSPRC